MDKLKNIFAQYGIFILGIFHFVGLVGIFKISQPLFAALSPLILLISALVLIAAEQGKRKGLVITIVFTFLLGYLVEVLGTKTGFPFGIYWYGDSLWPKVFGVPLVIGINWFLLTMGAGYFIRYIFTNAFFRIIFAALLMVMLDVFIEPVAKPLNYWEWLNNIIPLQNFIGWFGVSLLMQIAFHFNLKEHSNKVASAYFIIVAVFFMCLNIVL